MKIATELVKTGYLLADFFLSSDVVPGDRYGVDLLADLDLKHHHSGVAKGDFAGGQIEFPHPAEPLVVKGGDAGAFGHEAVTPRPQCVGIVQVQHFNVGDIKPGALDRGQHFG